MTGAELVCRLARAHLLGASEYKALLQDDCARVSALLQSEAQKAAQGVFGRKIYIRGLIEISNHCRNNCFYCGIRAGNGKLVRYRLDRTQIIDCCERGYALGFRTFVFQGGEDTEQNDDWVVSLVTAVRSRFPDCAITLSLGEKTPEAYRRFREAGADRYLLRHETRNAGHYGRLHPHGMSLENRLNCLAALKSLGYQTGSGIMVGSPYQSVDNLVEDLLYIQSLRPEMVGIGPFIHHPDTPFAAFPDGSVDLTLKLISIFRLMNPSALIPATTALVTLDPGARLKGILAGANVVMPNLSPAGVRGGYSLYEGKTAAGAESAGGIEELENELDTIGYSIAVDRGDYKYC